MRFLFFKFRFDPWTKTPQHTLPSPAVESRIELAPNGEKKISLVEAGRGQKGCSGRGGVGQPRLPPRAVPRCFPRVLERRSSGRDIRGGHIQREGPAAHHAHIKDAFCCRKEGRSGPWSGRALLRSAFTQKGKLAVLQDAALLNSPAAWSSR